MVDFASFRSPSVISLVTLMDTSAIYDRILNAQQGTSQEYAASL